MGKTRRIGVQVSALTALSFLCSCGIIGGSSDGGGGDAGSNSNICPTVGSKPCPNDAPFTQYPVDICNKCYSQFEAFDRCTNTFGPRCDASGHSESLSATPGCQAQFNSLWSCYSAGLPSDGGALGTADGVKDLRVASRFAGTACSGYSVCRLGLAVDKTNACRANALAVPS